MKLTTVLWIVLISGILTGCFHRTQDNPKFSVTTSIIEDKQTDKIYKPIINSSTYHVEQMNLMLGKILAKHINEQLTNEHLSSHQSLVDSILWSNGNSLIDSLIKSDSYYYTGIYYLINNNSDSAVIFLKLSWEIRDKLEIYDLRSAKALYNLALAYRNLGNYFKLEEYSSLSIKGYIKVLGDTTTELLDPYSALCGAYIELQEMAKAIEISNKALLIAESNIDLISARFLADIYSNLGVCYSRMANFSKAKIYLEKSEAICESNNLTFNESYLNLINSLAIVSDALRLNKKSFEYYQKGVTLAKTFPETTSYTLNIINSFAINLADSSKNEKAEELYTFIISKAAKIKKENPQLYYEVLNNYAEFLREYNKQNDSVIYAKSLDYNTQCMKYLLDNPEDHKLMDQIYIGYSLSLSKAGDPVKAIKFIQDLITEKYKIQNPEMTFGNPVLSDIKPDKLSLKIFKAKYNILWNTYTKTNDKEALKATAGTSEIVISLLEKIRINISEEESRLLLGDKYRDLYLNAINSFMQLYKDTSDKLYLEKAFEYAEKSKVAGLLSATRELKASQFNIPVDLADLEFRIKSNLSALSAMISENTNKEKPDKELIQELNNKVIRITLSRDSLISVFENEFPGYYSIKYNTRVALLENIPEIVGRNGNYVNYVMSDSLIYIFVANRKYSHLTSIKIDSVFYDQIKQFRSLLLMPGSSEDAATAFFKYQTLGYELYKKLIDPIRHYLISEKVIISPDNYLSYIPFETLPTEEVSETNLQYRSIHYLMEDFDISYTYSATFMSESVSSGINYANTTISFAPDYPDPIDVNAILMSRQEDHGILSDLPFARLEAEYVSEITNGLLFENTDAKESVFKNSAGDYDIIHLAMHTLMNDKDPMRSTLVFSPEKDSLNDGYLKTFEVYGLPLKAKMVVLSSCNTGNGFLSSGEGILSLARGFIYSGSKSVVMSMWEIEDRSGTEIVKMFYRNLKRGYSKSESLRRARISYLKNSDQLRSHPYFWSALVVYGDNSPLYFSRYLVAGLIALGVILSVLITLYLRKRRYS